MCNYINLKNSKNIRSTCYLFHIKQIDEIGKIWRRNPEIKRSCIIEMLWKK